MGSIICRLISMDPTLMASFEEVKNIPNHPEKVLVDVRGDDEVAKGFIPASVHIPLSNVEDALKMSPEAFKDKFARDKPSEDDVVIFYCQMGGRALKATNSAIGLGYKNAKCYKGSWSEWSSKSSN